MWVIGYDGAEGFAEADRRYYASDDAATSPLNDRLGLAAASGRYLERIDLAQVQRIARARRSRGHILARTRDDGEVERCLT